MAKSEFDKAALTDEHLRGEFTTVFTGHRALHALDDRRTQASVVLELLGAVVHRDASFFADELVVGAFIGVLEAAPTTHVVHENRVEVRGSSSNVVYQLLQRVTTIEAQPALSSIFVG